MLGCRKVRGLIAESLYEDLNPADRRVLEGHLARCPGCAEEAKAFGLLVSSIPAERAELDRDLVAALRGRLDEGAPLGSRGGFRLAFAGLAAGVLGVVLTGYVAMVNLSAEPGPARVAVGDAPEALASPLQAGLEAGERLIAAGDFSKAYLVLSSAIEADPEDKDAGLAQLRLADLAFRELRWYPEAFDAYDVLRYRYGGVFRSETDNVTRLNLLDEARGTDGSFASLHALDAARLSEGFEDFERVVSGFPATYVASVAAADMARLSADRGPGAQGAEADAMQAALEQCSDPVAIAQLKVELGHILRREEKGLTRAKALFEEVVESGHTVLARLARESLVELDGRGSP